MPRAKKICTFPSCTVRISSGSRCDEHRYERQAEPWHRNNPYGDKLPEKVKRQVLDRDRHRCYRPFPSLCTIVAKEVDHFIPKWKGGTDEMKNLKGICPECHERKSALEGVEARAKRK